MKKHKIKENKLIVTYNDEETNLELILEELKKGKFQVEGEPVYLQKW